jgi:hypothetical protein
VHRERGSIGFILAKSRPEDRTSPQFRSSLPVRPLHATETTAPNAKNASLPRLGGYMQDLGTSEFKRLLESSTDPS